MALSGMTNTYIVAGVGVVVIILFSVLGWVVYPNEVASQSTIKPENDLVYEPWVIPPIPIYMQFYVFDCINCNQTRFPISPNIKPILVQRGPFTYSETREKFNITLNNGLLKYQETLNYTYAPLAGEEPLTTRVTQPNFIYFTLISLINDVDRLNASTKTALSTLVHSRLDAIGEKPFMTRTVDEILIGGWSLKPLLDAILNITIPGTNDTIFDLLPPELVALIPEDPRFGYFYGDSGNLNGAYKEIENGENGLDRLGLIRSFDGKTELNYWNDTYCDMLNGTDAAIFPPNIDTKKNLYVFDSSICRSIYASYEKDVETLGIAGKRYTIPEIVFANDTVNEDNRCFQPCLRDPNRECVGGGVLDLRSCLFGAPLVLSLPHFYQGDEKYINAVDGLSPNQEEHQTFFDVEPITGIPMDEAKRIQINIDVRSYNVPRLQLNINNTIFPVLWLNESAKLDEASANDLNQLFALFDAVNIGRWCFLAAGIALMVASMIMFAVYFPRLKQNKVV